MRKKSSEYGGLEMQTQELITITDLARRLKLHPETTRGLYRHGRIPGIRFGHRTLRFDYASVVEALKRNDRGKYE